jgi:cyanophycinase
MTGGNQLRLSAIVGGSPIARAIRHRHLAGAVVGGTSAGAAVLSEHMIAYGREGASPRAGMVSVVPGLGLVNRIIIDQHFRQRDRLGRLLTALAYNPFAVGIGLDEDTALIIENDDWARVIGSNAVTVVDASSVSHSEMGCVREGEPISLLGLRLHVLVEGASFNLRTREARPALRSEEELERRLEKADLDLEGVPSDETPTGRNGESER